MANISNITTEGIIAQLMGAGSANMFPHIINTMRNITLPNREQIYLLIRSTLDHYADCACMSFVQKHGGDTLVLKLICFIGYFLYSKSDSILMNIHMILAATLPIIIGSYGALARPSSAAPANRPSSPGSRRPSEEQDDHEDEVEKPTVVTLGIDTAVMAPFVLAIALVSISYLLKWYPDTFKKVMSGYFSIIGVYSLSQLAIDALNVLRSLVFPAKWHSGGKTYRIDSGLSQHLVSEDEKEALDVANDKITPFPGPLSSSKLLARYSLRLWDIRALFSKRWLLKGYVHKIFSFSSYLTLNDAIGVGIGATLIALWHLGGKPWPITNLMGIASVYNMFQFTSPGKFSTGFLILSLLLVYDIYMVYFTGIMQQVAMAMEDSPVKLYFPNRSGKGTMLGLGDIIIPGLMVAFVLRFDLYLFYLRKQTVVSDDPSLQDRLRSSLQSTRSGLPLKIDRLVKAPYVEATGQWGHRFWNRGAQEQEHNGYTFPKVYFSAAMYGYCIGFILTLLVCNLTKYSVPALMTLCPCVMFSLSMTALRRGELNLMWSYDESVQDDGVNRNSETQDHERNMNAAIPKMREPGNEQIRKDSQNDASGQIFLFSLSAPPERT